MISLKHAKVDAQLTWQVVCRHVLTVQSFLTMLGFFVLILFILQWLFNYQQLGFILGNSTGLSFYDKINFLVEAFINIFRFGSDIVPISMILIALFQSVALTLYLKLRHFATHNKSVKSSVGSLTFGLLGSGCVACGGSLLTPLLGALASNVSVTLAERLGDILLVLAVILSYRALSKVAFIYATEITKETKNA